MYITTSSLQDFDCYQASNFERDLPYHAKKTAYMAGVFFSCGAYITGIGLSWISLPISTASYLSRFNSFSGAILLWAALNILGIVLKEASEGFTKYCDKKIKHLEKERVEELFDR